MNIDVPEADEITICLLFLLFVCFSLSIILFFKYRISYKQNFFFYLFIFTVVQQDAHFQETMEHLGKVCFHVTYL